jgi:hypothetical protein
MCHIDAHAQCDALGERFGDRHQQARRDAFAGYIAHQHEQALAVEHEKIVEVAADRARRFNRRREVETPFAREACFATGKIAACAGTSNLRDSR